MYRNAGKPFQRQRFYGHESLEEDNIHRENELKDKINNLKHLSIEIGEEVRDHNRLLAGIDNNFDQTFDSIVQSMKRFFGSSFKHLYSSYSIMSDSAKHGAALQTYNNEIVRCLEELSLQRRALQVDIDNEEKSKQDIQRQMVGLRSRLESINAVLNDKLAKRDSFDKLIAESEEAYLKILESSQALLNHVKKDSDSLLLQGPVSSHQNDKRGRR